MEPTSNIVSLSHWRNKKTKEQQPASGSVPVSYDKALVDMRSDINKLTEALLEVAQMAQSNRDYLLKLLRLLKEEKSR